MPQGTNQRAADLATNPSELVPGDLADALEDPTGPHDRAPPRSRGSARWSPARSTPNFVRLDDRCKLFSKSKNSHQLGSRPSGVRVVAPPDTLAAKRMEARGPGATTGSTGLRHCTRLSSMTRRLALSHNAQQLGHRCGALAQQRYVHRNEELARERIRRRWAARNVSTSASESVASRFAPDGRHRGSAGPFAHVEPILAIAIGGSAGISRIRALVGVERCERKRTGPPRSAACVQPVGSFERHPGDTQSSVRRRTRRRRGRYGLPAPVTWAGTSGGGSSTPVSKSLRYGS